MTSANPNAANSYTRVTDWEELGRSVFSKSHFRTKTRRVLLGAFLERLGEKNMSVDRFTRALASISLEELAAMSRRIAAQRNPPRRFYGWGVVTAERVRGENCQVIDSPIPDNTYHADIVLPDEAIESEDAQRGYAATLAGMARWSPYPPQTENKPN